MDKYWVRYDELNTALEISKEIKIAWRVYAFDCPCIAFTPAPHRGWWFNRPVNKIPDVCSPICIVNGQILSKIWWVKHGQSNPWAKSQKFAWQVHSFDCRCIALTPAPRRVWWFNRPVDIISNVCSPICVVNGQILSDIRSWRRSFVYVQ